MSAKQNFDVALKYIAKHWILARKYVHPGFILRVPSTQLARKDVT